jgi:ribose 5-phosphate isomerase A
MPCLLNHPSIACRVFQAGMHARGRKRQMLYLGGEPILRLGKMKDGPVITDNGNFVLDVDFGTIEEPAELGARMSLIPGVVVHGIFDNLDELYLAKESWVEIIRGSGLPSG